MKVLSIDFDQIMQPCIKLYNDLSGCETNATKNWKRIERERSIDKFLNQDANALILIAKIIKENIKNGASFSAIQDHQEIAKDLNNIKDKIDLTNIDFHHDIMQRQDEDAAIKLYDEDDCDCSNWVGQMYIKDKLNSYTWVRAPQSDDFDFKTSIVAEMEKIYNQMSLYQLNEIPCDFDRVYFCLSPQWIPYKFEHLYNLIVELVS